MRPRANRRSVTDAVRPLAGIVASPLRRLYHHLSTGVPRGQRVSLWLLALDLLVVAAAVVAVLWEQLGWVEAIVLVVGFSFLTDLMVARSMERTRHLDAKSGVEAMLGGTAVVEDDFALAGSQARGRVRYQGESWAARAEAPPSPRRGETVTIVAVDGLTLHVAREDDSERGVEQGG